VGEHGEEQRVQVAGDIPPILCAEHRDIGVVRLYYAREGLLLELQELNSLVRIAGGEAGTECDADEVLGDRMVVELLEAFGYGVDLVTVSISCCGTVKTSSDLPWLLLFPPLPFPSVLA
jgi:hypothetical protein